MDNEQLTKVVRLQQDAIDLHQQTLQDYAQFLQGILKLLGKLANVTEELTVQQFVTEVEKVDKCGQHCGCEKHNG